MRYGAAKQRIGIRMQDRNRHVWQGDLKIIETLGNAGGEKMKLSGSVIKIKIIARIGDLNKVRAVEVERLGGEHGSKIAARSALGGKDVDLSIISLR